MNRRTALAMALAVVCLGGKCINYDARLATSPSTPTSGAFVPAVPCSVPNEAHISVQEFVFLNECGCLEPPQSSEEVRTCTVPAGTTIVWSFSGSQRHSVDSTDAEIDSSGERLRGRYVVKLDDTGEFPYRCALHAAEMSNYRIVVLPPAE